VTATANVEVRRRAVELMRGSDRLGYDEAVAQATLREMTCDCGMSDPRRSVGRRWADEAETAPAPRCPTRREHVTPTR
jgi:hypothetical protein